MYNPYPLQNLAACIMCMAEYKWTPTDNTRKTNAMIMLASRPVLHNRVLWISQKNICQFLWHIDASILYIDDLNAVTKMANNSSGIIAIKDVKDSHEELLEGCNWLLFNAMRSIFLCV